MLLGLASNRKDMVIVDCNMALASKLMLPKSAIIRHDLLALTPTGLKSHYKQNLSRILESGSEGFTSLIFFYRGDRG